MCVCVCVMNIQYSECTALPEKAVGVRGHWWCTHAWKQYIHAGSLSRIWMTVNWSYKPLPSLAVVDMMNMSTAVIYSNIYNRGADVWFSVIYMNMRRKLLHQVRLQVAAVVGQSSAASSHFRVFQFTSTHTLSSFIFYDLNSAVFSLNCWDLCYIPIPAWLYGFLRYIFLAGGDHFGQGWKISTTIGRTAMNPLISRVPPASGKNVRYKLQLLQKLSSSGWRRIFPQYSGQRDSLWLSLEQKSRCQTVRKVLLLVGQHTEMTKHDMTVFLIHFSMTKSGGHYWLHRAMIPWQKGHDR